MTPETKTPNGYFNAFAVCMWC